MHIRTLISCIHKLLAITGQLYTCCHNYVTPEPLLYLTERKVVSLCRESHLLAGRADDEAMETTELGFWRDGRMSEEYKICGQQEHPEVVHAERSAHPTRECINNN